MGRIAAIKYARNTYPHLSLKEAKDLIEGIERELTSHSSDIIEAPIELLSADQIALQMLPAATIRAGKSKDLDDIVVDAYRLADMFLAMRQTRLLIGA